MIRHSDTDERPAPPLTPPPPEARPVELLIAVALGILAVLVPGLWWLDRMMP